MTNPDIGFELENFRRRMIVYREFFGANTPEGHRASNLVELRQNYETAGSEEQKANIRKSMDQQCADLERLKLERDRRAQ